MRNLIITKYFDSPFGELILGSLEDQLCLCDWRYRKQRNRIDDRIKKCLNSDFEIGTSSVIEQTETQLIEYFNKERETFSVPMLLAGTDFQKSVWDILCQISYGKTQSYLELSQYLNNPKAIRAIASANGANALSILIPCHRIIGHTGDLVGYAGGLEAKKNLLLLEGSQNQLDLFS